MDVAAGQFAELGDQIMRKQRALFVFLVALKRYSERMSHKRLRPSRRLARLLHAPDEAAIEVEFGIIDGHGPHCRRPRRSAKGTRATFAPPDKGVTNPKAGDTHVPQKSGQSDLFSRPQGAGWRCDCAPARGRYNISHVAQRSKWCADALNPAV